MKVIICSDTHASQNYIDLLIERIEAYAPDCVIHLGDYWSDADQLRSDAYDLIRVPGTWTPFYQNPDIDNRKFEELNGWSFFLSHTPTHHFNDLPGDVDPQEVIRTKACDILCHGHTHHPKVARENGVWVLNPGHLKEGDDRGYPPSYAICSISDTIIECSVITLHDGSPLITEVLHK
jgi:hypothetical protein